MLLLLILAQIEFKNYEDLQLKSVLITAITALGVVIFKMYTNHKKEIKEKDDQLTKKDDHVMKILEDHQREMKAVVNNHRDDLKAHNNDYSMMVDKLQRVIDQIKEISSHSSRYNRDK